MLSTSAAAGALPPAVSAESIARGTAQDLIVEFDSRAVDQEARQLRLKRGLDRDDAQILGVREARFRQIKAGVRSALPDGEYDVVTDFHVLPFAMVRVRTSRALAALAGHGSVVGIYRDAVKYAIPDKIPQLDSATQTLIGQPVARAAGLTGAGTTVLVIDTGANYTVADLGSCSGAATPANCRVSHALYVNSGNSVVGDPTPAASTYNNHGTNVASIVAGVAVATKVAVINVFGTNTSTSDSKILAAINWGIANQAVHNIRALNLSLGDNSSNSTPCSTGNPYVSAFSAALAAGIVPVTAAGNNGYLTGIAAPACTPGAVSVGAVYVTNYGSVGWTTCTDATTAANKVTCFSNSASILSLLAPGAIITAGGQTFGGTSQASPFAAASIALLYGAYPTATTTQQVSRLISGGIAVTDSRNGLTKPRLDLTAIAAAASPYTGDVPALPEWMAVLAGAAFFAAATRRRSA
ncbi:MAG TPA: S8 family serine peptidase [Rhodocyclaceae bacterium]|nr:S8 family serine peptidase [Rhodocyclaceae bacterium]